MKLIINDPRYKGRMIKKWIIELFFALLALGKLSEKKQTFNEYKTQRGVEEKEEERRLQKENKEKLIKFLETHPKMSSTIRYRVAEEMYRSLTIWNSVPERDRRDLYEDLVVNLARREKENARLTRKNNMCKLTQVLHDLGPVLRYINGILVFTVSQKYFEPDAEKLSHKTLWKEAQDLLLEEPLFNEDTNLQNMDKEDALGKNIFR